MRLLVWLLPCHPHTYRGAFFSRRLLHRCDYHQRRPRNLEPLAMTIAQYIEWLAQRIKDGDLALIEARLLNLNANACTRQPEDEEEIEVLL